MSTNGVLLMCKYFKINLILIPLSVRKRINCHYYRYIFSDKEIMLGRYVTCRQEFSSLLFLLHVCLRVFLEFFGLITHFLWLMIVDVDYSFGELDFLGVEFEFMNEFRFFARFYWRIIYTRAATIKNFIQIT